MPIVELEKCVWLATWQGDPGRTLDIRSAKHFKTYKAAEFALMGARNYRPFANAVIRPTPRALDGDTVAPVCTCNPVGGIHAAFCPCDRPRQ